MNNNLNEGYFPKEYNERFQNEFSKLKGEKKWGDLILFLEKLSITYPKEYFLFTELSSAYYVLEKKDKCIENALKAYQIEPRDPLVIYNYAMALSLNAEYKKSLVLFYRIYKSSIKHLAFGIYGEGLKWAKSLKNDTRYMIGVTYLEMKNREKAKFYIKQHLINRKRGIYSDFTRIQVIKKLQFIG